MNGTGVRADTPMTVPASASRRVERPASQAQAHPILDGVWALQLPLCYASVASVNAYLLRVDGGWILVDCGSSLAPGWDALALAFTHAGAALEDVELLVVTHSHADHRGLAAQIVERTGCGFAMGAPPHPPIDVLRDRTIALEARRARGLREGVPERLLDSLVDELPAGDGNYALVEPDRILQPDEQLQTQSGDWRAIAAPGHSADQIMLWNARQRLLISADLALPGVPSFLEYGTRPDPHSDQLASLDRAIALDPALLLPGHGHPNAAPESSLRRCREMVADRVDGVRAALGASALSAWEIVESMSPPRAAADHLQRILAETLCVLEFLEMRHQARALLDDQRRRRWLAERAVETARS